MGQRQREVHMGKSREAKIDQGGGEGKHYQQLLNSLALGLELSKEDEQDDWAGGWTSPCRSVPSDTS